MQEKCDTLCFKPTPRKTFCVFVWFCLWDLFVWFFLLAMLSAKTNAYLDLICMRNSQPFYCPEITKLALCLQPAELALQRLKRFGVCAAALICHFICQPGVSSVLFVYTCPCWPDGAGFGCHPKHCIRKARLCVVFQKPRSAASSAPLVKNQLDLIYWSCCPCYSQADFI